MWKRILSLVCAFLLTAAIAFPAATVHAQAAAESEQYPVVTAILPTVKGFRLDWTAFDGASAYRVFVRNGTKWKALGDTAQRQYFFTGGVNGKTFVFTVRPLNAKGTYCGTCKRAGWSAVFYSAPKITAVRSVYSGLKVVWDAVPGVTNYRVLVQRDGHWKTLGNTTKTFFIDRTAPAGKTGKYTVRCLSADGKAYLSSFHSGVSGTFTPAPQISSFASRNGALRLTWNKVSGVAKYRVFQSVDGAWKRLADTNKDYYDFKGVSANGLYTFTLVALDANGKSLSGYSSKGWSGRYLAPPAFTSVSDNTLTWKANAYAAKYRVYRKTYGGSWKALATTAKTTFTDTTAPKNEPYTYTLRYIDSEGHLCSFFKADNPYYCNGAPANGKFGSTTFVNGRVRQQGYVTEGGKTYYYDAKGNLKKNGIVGDSKSGYRYADKNGVVDKTYQGALEQGGAKWIVENGKAYKAVNEHDVTLYRAFKEVEACTTPSMTKAQKLKASFKHIQGMNERNPRIPHNHDKGWELVYANDVFVDRCGNCMSYGAAMAFMARAIGYKETYACNSGGHGWAEIEGKVYDPEWSIHYHSYSYYGMTYDEPCDVHYAAAISPGYSWMHVAV
ncbi:MAG: hypothetical protein II738_05200 [Clostridia bacterium]|nr:hypothetical protein [Clostridia bacterium]